MQNVVGMKGEKQDKKKNIMKEGARKKEKKERGHERKGKGG